MLVLLSTVIILLVTVAILTRTTILTLLAGVVGFEPTHVGVRVRCLTAWRYPNIHVIILSLYLLFVESFRKKKRKKFQISLFFYFMVYWITVRREHFDIRLDSNRFYFAVCVTFVLVFLSALLNCILNRNLVYES